MCDEYNFKLSIIHNNDFHANYLPIKSYNNAECFEKNYDNDTQCVGGVARTVAKVKQIRNEINEKFENNSNILFLNAGDHFQGTSWYTILKSKVVADFVRLMEHDVMTLGNHEFDDGPEELEKFLRHMENDSLPIVSCNIEFDDELKYLKENVKKSIVIKMKNDVKVAIIGYITPDTKFLSSPGKHVHFFDEIESIQKEIQALKSEHPELNIFIGLGHSGYDRDIEIATKIPELDIIVGGHSHTYLQSNMSEKYPSIEKATGPYPTIIEHAINTSDYSGNVTQLIVQAYALGKYLGLLEVDFNEQGEIINYSGESMLMTHDIPEDEETRKLVDEYNEQLSEKYNEEFGTATDSFEQPKCRSEECSIGNLIADSFVDGFDKLDNPQSKSLLRHWRRKRNNDNDGCQLIALINSGNIRTSIDKGSITYRKLISVLPFTNSLGILTLNGSELWNLFENSAKQHDRGGFLQLSSTIRVKYKIKHFDESKFFHEAQLLDLKTLCYGRWQQIDENKQYKVIVNSFISHGGDNYSVNIDNWLDYQYVDREVLSEYIRSRKHITPKLDGRIKIINKNDNDNTNSTSNLSELNTYLLIFVIILLSLNTYGQLLLYKKIIIQ